MPGRQTANNRIQSIHGGCRCLHMTFFAAALVIVTISLFVIGSRAIDDIVRLEERTGG